MEIIGQFLIMRKNQKTTEKRKVKIMRDNKLIAIDLFCGCGGFSYGFQQAGFEMASRNIMLDEAMVQSASRIRRSKRR